MLDFSYISFILNSTANRLLSSIFTFIHISFSFAYLFHFCHYLHTFILKFFLYSMMMSYFRFQSSHTFLCFISCFSILCSFMIRFSSHTLLFSCLFPPLFYSTPREPKHEISFLRYSAPLEIKEGYCHTSLTIAAWIISHDDVSRLA